MKKMIQIFIFMISIVLSIDAGTIVTVRKDGGGNSTTITAALALVGGGDVVEIQDDSVYQENVVINASIELRAALGVHPTIQDVSGSSVIQCNANATIKGLKINGNYNATAGINQGAPILFVQDCEIYAVDFNGMENGINSSGYSKLSVNNCVFYNNGHGINAVGTDSVIITNCAFNSNGLSMSPSWQPAILHNNVSFPLYLEVGNCVINNNGIGIKCDFTTGSIHDNTINTNSGSGIICNNCENSLTIRNNKIQNNTASGIFLDESEPTVGNSIGMANDIFGNASNIDGTAAAFKTLNCRFNNWGSCNDPIASISPANYTVNYIPYYGDTLHFDTLHPPLTPSVSSPSPADGTTGLNTSVTISWVGTSASGNKLIYDLDVWDSLGTHVAGIYDTLASSITVNNLSFDKWHWWQVNAQDCNETSLSPSYWFKTKANSPPVITGITITPDPVVANLNLNLQFQVNDPDGHSLTLQYNWGDGNPTQFINNYSPGTALSLDHTYNTQGTYYLFIQATDSVGGSDSTTTTIVVNEQRTLALTQPTGNSVYYGGDPLNIEYTFTGSINAVNIYFSSDNRATWQPLVENTPCNGQWSWNVPLNMQSANCFILISDYEDAGVQSENAAAFRIDQYLKMVSPLPGAIFEVGQTIPVRWVKNNYPSPINLLLSTDNGLNYTQIYTEAKLSALNAQSPASVDTLTYNWLIPASAVSNTCRLKVVSQAQPQYEASHEAPFRILTQRTLSLTRPNGGEQLPAGKTDTIRWNSTGAIDSIRLLFSSDNDATRSVIHNRTPNTGQFIWNPALINSSQCRITIRQHNDSTINDQSDNPFQIYFNSLTLVTPNGGDTWEKDNAYPIRWSYSGIINQLDIILLITSAGSVVTYPLAQEVSVGDTLYNWFIADSIPASDSARIVLQAVGAVNVADTSSQFFTIRPKRQIVITNPNGGELVLNDRPCTIQWEAPASVTRVKLEYRASMQSSFSLQSINIPNTGSFEWTPPQVSTVAADIRLTDMDSSAIFDINDQGFIISFPPEFSFDSPLAGDVVFFPDTVFCRWQTQYIAPRVNLAYSIDTSQFWIPIADSLINTGSYNWIAQNVSDHFDKLRLRLQCSGYNDIESVSDSFILSVLPTVEWQSPAQNDLLVVGDTAVLNWLTTGYIPILALWFSADDGSNWQLMDSAVVNQNLFNWVVPDISSARCRLKVVNSAPQTEEFVSPRFEIRANGGVYANPTQVSFDPTYIAACSEKPLHIINRSEDSRQISNVQFARYSTIFSLEGSLPIAISSQDSTRLALKFCPADTIFYSDTLFVNLDNGDRITLPVSGKGALPPISLMRKPTLRSITSSQAALEVIFNHTVTCRIRYGLTPQTLNSEAISLIENTQHLLYLNNLSDNTVYYYVVEAYYHSIFAFQNQIGSFQTLASQIPKDIPFIGGLDPVYIGEREMTVRFTTDQALKGICQIRVPGGSAIFSEESDSVLTHFFRFENLQPNQQYLLIPGIQTTSGAIWSPRVYPLRTLAEPDRSPSHILRGPFAVSTDSLAFISLIADEGCQAWLYLFQGAAIVPIDTLRSEVFKRRHVFFVFNLIPGQVYHISILLKDGAGNETFWDGGADLLSISGLYRRKATSGFGTNSFSTNTNSDQRSPEFVAQPVLYANTDSSALIKWETNEASGYSLSLYDPASQLVAQIENQDYQTENVVTINRLIPGTTYRALLTVFDLANNSSSPLEDLVFTLPQMPPDVPIVMVDSAEYYIGDNFALMSWQTNLPCDSRSSLATSQMLVNPFYYYEPSITDQHLLVMNNLNSQNRYYYQLFCHDLLDRLVLTTETDSFSISGSNSEPLSFTTEPALQSVSPTRAVFTWQTNRLAYAYMDYWQADDPTDTITVSRPDLANIHEIVITGLKADLRYGYRAYAWDIAGGFIERWSEFMTLDSSSMDQNPPQSPSFVRIQRAESDPFQVTVTWPANHENDFSHYQFKRVINADTQLIASSLKDTSFTERLLMPNGSYSYGVQCIDINQNRSNWSWSTPLIITGMDDSVAILKRNQFYLSAPQPNPATTQTLIYFRQMEAGVITLSVYNILGHQLYQDIFHCPAQTEISRSIDATPWPDGLYFVSAVNEQGERKTRKLIIIH